MAIPPAARRGAATAASGVLVLGSGLSVGVLAADMHRTWAGGQALETQAAVQSPVGAGVPEPVVVKRVTVRRVTPEPVIVRKKVYRTVRGAAPPQASGGSSGSSGSGSTRKAPSPGGSGSSGSTSPRRSVVAPAPAPAPVAAKPPAATTSKSS